MIYWLRFLYVENNYLRWDEAQAFDKEMAACRISGGSIQNKYALISADNRLKLHIDVAADPLTALSGKINGILGEDSVLRGDRLGCMVRWKTRM